MNKFKKSIIESLKWIWQFPQNMLAVCFEGILCNAATRGVKEDGNQIIWCDVLPSAMSLGDYLFMPTNASKESIEHECGHSRQSDILGPLYLIVIGIPSVIHNIVHAICYKLGLKWDYYKFYTEHWLMGSDD